MVKRFIKFGIVGATGVVIDFSVTYFLRDLIGINQYFANICGFAIAASSNYLINRLWTFRSKNNNIAKEYIKYLLISIIGLFINSTVLWLIYETAGANFYISKSIAIAITTIWNFGANSLITFRK